MYKLNPELKGFWRTKSRTKVLHGGRASSKSHDCAGVLTYLAANYRLKVMCARQFQNRIDESVYTLIRDKIYDSDYMRDYQLLKNSIVNKRTGSEFLFYGIARNLTEIKSTEGIDILYLEEANYLTQEQWDILEPTIRKDGSEIWMLFNPDEYTDFVYQNFVVNTPDDCAVMQINWEKNPFLSETMIKVIKSAYARDPELARHIYGGEPKMSGDKSVIPLIYVMAACNAHIKLAERNPELYGHWNLDNPILASKRRVGYDIADDGDDVNSTVRCDGNIITEIDEWHGMQDQILKSSIKVYNYAREIDASVTFDCIGVGAQAGSKFNELNEFNDPHYKLEHHAFNAGAGVDDPEGIYLDLPHTKITNQDYFANLKAQKWVEVSTRFRKTYEAVELGIEHPWDELISIDEDSVGDRLNRLKIELAAPRKDVDGLGRFKVESKKDMRDKRKIKSPNMADALIMAAAKPVTGDLGFFDLF